MAERMTLDDELRKLVEESHHQLIRVANIRKVGTKKIAAAFNWLTDLASLDI
jgi:hypothetical protein